MLDFLEQRGRSTWSILRDNCSHIFIYFFVVVFLVALVGKVCVCTCASIRVHCTLLVTTSLKSQVENQQFNCLVKMRSSKVCLSPVVYVLHFKAAVVCFHTPPFFVVIAFNGFSNYHASELLCVLSFSKNVQVQ